MGSITLNKPSGGQLTLSPEDGTTNETVTVSSIPGNRILQQDLIVANTTHKQTTLGYTTIAGYSQTVTPTVVGSEIFIEAVIHVYVYPPASDWEAVHPKIYVDGVSITPDADNANYGVGLFATDAVDRMMGYATVGAKYTTTSLTPVNIEVKMGTGTPDISGAQMNEYGVGYMKYMEVAN